LIPSAPELLTDAHGLAEFECAKPALNDWLRTHAISNQAKGFTRVLVVHSKMRVVGFYGLAPTSIPPNVLSQAVRTGQHPDPVPCLLLAQLAVDKDWTGRGVGRGLLKSALLRCIAGAAMIGGRAVIVRAIDAEAEKFWERHGFRPSRDDRSTLFRAIADIEAWLPKIS
jgi:GNAT superfamily N-acetyltransferase